MKDVVEKEQIFLFGTSSLVNQEDSKPVIISALIDLAGVIGRRLIEKPERPFFVFLDEFYTAAYPGLNDLISLGREANVCFFLAHHSLGQLGAVSQEFKDDILTNTNHKIVMNITEKDTVDFFAAIFGTKVTKKDVYSYDTRISQPRGRTEKTGRGIHHPSQLPEGNEARGSGLPDCLCGRSEGVQNETQGSQTTATGFRLREMCSHPE